jgi:5-oxoprolinase (ATP-hydrolysing) subunit C
MALIVIDPGLSTTVQDSGRPGYREWGVPLGGAFDRGSAELANALVGNPPGCAELELTLLGGTYQADCPLALALAGAQMEAKVVCPDSTEHLLLHPTSFSLQAGDKLVLGRTLTGARTYLAVRGGWQTSLRLGSRSSEERIQPGDTLTAQSGTISTRHLSRSVWEAPAEGPFCLIAGPDGRATSALDEAFWSGRRFQVGSLSDRMGLRLQGDPVAVNSPSDRLSTPVSPGAIQVAGGQLIVLGVACGTMGGYPHVAHVISPDLDRLAQLKPADPVRFRLVSLEEARLLDKEARARQRSLAQRLALATRDG